MIHDTRGLWRAKHRMGLACASCSVGKDCRIKPVEDAPDEKLRRQVKNFQSFDVFVEGVVKSKMLFTRSVLSQFVSGVLLSEILGVLQHYHFLIENLNEVELTFADFT